MGEAAQYDTWQHTFRTTTQQPMRIDAARTVLESKFNGLRDLQLGCRTPSFTLKPARRLRTKPIHGWLQGFLCAISFAWQSSLFRKGMSIKAKSVGSCMVQKATNIQKVPMVLPTKHAPNWVPLHPEPALRVKPYAITSFGVWSRMHQGPNVQGHRGRVRAEGGLMRLCCDSLRLGAFSRQPEFRTASILTFMPPGLRDAAQENFSCGRANQQTKQRLRATQ